MTISDSGLLFWATLYFMCYAYSRRLLLCFNRTCLWCSSRCFHLSQQLFLAHSLSTFALPSLLFNSRLHRWLLLMCRLSLQSEVSYSFLWQACISCTITARWMSMRAVNLVECCRKFLTSYATAMSILMLFIHLIWTMLLTVILLLCPH